jgi:hypothetical protein
LTRPFAALAVLLALAACDGPAATVKIEANEDARTQIVATEGGTTVKTVTAGGAVEVGTDLPAATPAYPGAAIKTQIASASSKDGGSGQIVVMTTGDPIAKVAAFYDANARAKGIAATMIVNDGDTAVRIYGDEKRGEGAMVAITREKGEDQTEIVITSGVKRDVRVFAGADGVPLPPLPPPPPPGDKAKVAAVMGGRLQ